MGMSAFFGFGTRPGLSPLASGGPPPHEAGPDSIRGAELDPFGKR